jgi:glutamate-1-semialdehyde 2,1-aminomutase
MLTPFFIDQPVTDFASAIKANTNAYATFFNGMLARGIYAPPSQFEAWFLSASHTAREIDDTIQSAREALADVNDMMIS